MDWMKYLAGGAAIGLIAGFWGQIKAVLWRIASLFVQRIEIPTEAAHAALVSYLTAHFRRSRFYDRMYGANYEHQRDGRYGLIPYELFGHRSVLFWRGWWPLVFSNAQEGKTRTGRAQPDNHEGGERSVAKVYSTLTYLRGTQNVEAILRAACASMNQLAWSVAGAEEEARNRFVIHRVPDRERDEDGSGHESNGLPWYRQASHRLLAHTPDQLGKMPLHGGRALDNLIFPQRVKGLIREIELWRNSRRWYLDRGIPWKRGWLLYGPPGTGKTALARAFAEDLNMPIYVFNLAEMGNHDLIKTWADMQVNVPCVALIEDIDNIFHGRENVSRKPGMMPLYLGRRRGGDDGEPAAAPAVPLTFDCLLNCLDGVERADGVFTIITTNDIAKVDPALGQPRTLPDGTVEFISTRPGRIDKAVELTYMEPGDKKQMARRILGDYPAQYQAMLEFIDRYPDLQETPAQFQERCAQVALACFWKEPPGGAKLLTSAPAPPQEADREPESEAALREAGSAA
jgi:hypothetical protein